MVSCKLVTLIYDIMLSIKVFCVAYLFMRFLDLWSLYSLELYIVGLVLNKIVDLVLYINDTLI